MKKKNILIIILVFLVCAFLGYKAAQKIFPSSRLTANNLDVKNPSSHIIQNNYLVIHIDDRTLDKPKLISIWAAFVNQSDSLQLMFVPLFPATNPEIHDKIANSFKVNQDKTLNATFINQVNKAFEIKTSGYLLADDAATVSSIQWLTGASTTLASTPAVTDMDKNHIRSSEGASYQQFCQILSAGSGNAYVSAINWNNLLPDHFYTDLPFETLALVQDQIKYAVSPVQWVVYVGR